MTTPGTQLKPKKDLRYYSLDFWRGVACLMVVIFHSTFYITENPAHAPGSFFVRKIYSALSWGWAGVPLFFVISGYCIAAACESVGISGSSMSRYFFRRFKRIYPPYWIVLLLLIALHLILGMTGHREVLTDKIVPLPEPASLSPWQWFGSLSLTEVWRAHLVGPKERLLLGPGWSLCYEEQFYFICGILILFGRRWFYRAMAILTLAVVGVVVVNEMVNLHIDGFFFDGRWLMFAAGVLVFYTVQRGGPKARPKALALLGTVFLLVIVWAIVAHARLGREMAFSCAFAFALILLHRRDREMAVSPILRPVMICGAMCYSFYLIHWPVVKIVTHLCYDLGITGNWSTLVFTIPLGVFITAGLAWLFHLAVERRFMNTLPSIPPTSKHHAAYEAAPAAVVGDSVVVAKPEA